MGSQGLWVIHSEKRGIASHELSGEFAKSISHLFSLETCQRKIWISATCCDGLTLIPGSEIYSGEAAYSFLLQIACGLRSEIQGETEVFGQLKEAWAKWSARNDTVPKELSQWMQALFADTKEIRSEHLRNIGNTSYGGLVRKLIRKNADTEFGEPILLVGAGHLAHAIAPYLLEHELWIWNRSRESLSHLAEELMRKPKSKIRLVANEEQEWAWKTAAHIVVCIPPDSAGQDAERIQWLKERKDRPTFLHLGINRVDLGEWQGCPPPVHCLDDLFELQRHQNQTRSELFARALKACQLKARLRFLPGSPFGTGSMSHGWEDLAAFG